MTTITELEGKILNAIAHHEMNSGNGATPRQASDVCTWSWADAFGSQAGVSTATAKGAMGSLAAKGLINCGGFGRDADVSFTEEGFVAWKNWFEEKGLPVIG